MQKYTKSLTINITEVQHSTLQKLSNRGIKSGNFIRQAISEKIKRDASELIDKSKIEYCPFDN